MAKLPIREALGRAKRIVANLAGIQGVDFGVLYANGRSRGRKLGIRFHLAHKLPLNEISADAVLPREIGGYPCDVIEASYEPHATRPTDMFETLQPGISVGNLERQSTGSLGGFVRDLRTGVTCCLSNWHVLCGSSVAAMGDAIVQPGPQHLGTLVARQVGTLLRWTDLSHGIDAAIASLGAIARQDIPFGLQAPVVGVDEPVVGMRVVKSGVITGVTHGIVDGVEGSYSMNYEFFGDSRRWMDGIRVVVDPEQPVDEISMRGDSGAMWIDPSTNRAVALHFGGEDGLGALAEYALAHPLPRVLSSLEVELN